MYKYTEFASYFIMLIMSILFPCTAFTCIHDDVTLTKPSAIYPRSVKHYKDIKNERIRNQTLFEPLDVHFYLDNIESSVSSNTIYNIDQALRKVTAFLRKTLQVRKRKRPFHIEREGCVQRWHSGINKGKCSKFKSGEEICAIKGIAYEIPQRLLSSLGVYNFEGNEPGYTAPGGPGITDANFVIFVAAQHSESCDKKEDTVAYGSFCRLDPKTNEPLAGLINLCPSYFTKKVYPMEHYYNVLLHEVIHILGFSLRLIEKFLYCQKGVPCQIPKHVIVEEATYVGRMVFPDVIYSTQKHFNCSRANFGAPMAPAIDKSGKLTHSYTSHWHPVLMYSSIMSTGFTEFDNVLVDNITLSLLATTGWYKVNFSNADRYTFGKDEGCEFGLDTNTCSSPFLCKVGQNATGCDMLHNSIGKCTSLVDFEACGVFRPFTQENCEAQSQKEYSLDYYALAFQRKCFSHIRTNGSNIPSCLPVKCTTENTYSILLNKTWYPCQFENEIKAEGQTVKCVDSILFCNKTSALVSRQPCPADNYFSINIRMLFKQPTFQDLDENHSFKNFKVATLRGVARIMKMPLNYIVNSSLTVFKQIYLDFTICPPGSLNPREVVTLVENAQKFLDSGSYRDILKGPKDMIIASEKMQIEPMDVVAFSDDEGYRVLLAFPFIGGVFLIVTLIASLLRLYLIQKHKPRRQVLDVTSDQK